ncbi:MAG: D-aminoacylase [SAR202 cluster bacterium]|nr:D-aminoacylase [SAR202 cluster bacterium]
MLDLLIKGGMVLDGAANPGIHAAVGVEGDTVSIHRGDVSGLKARRVLDATGRVVCPGFIDVHAHSALMILADPLHYAKVHQGVTTELYGIDGNSYAPFRKQQDLDWFIQMNSGLEGWPDIEASWSTVAEYMDTYDRKIAVNMAYIVGNSPIRINAMGWDNRKPTRKQMDTQKALLREAMEEGAVGMSTGLDYPPGAYADTAELVELSKELTKLGGFYHTHVRYLLGDQHLDPFREAIDIGKRSGSPIHITHLLGNWKLKSSQAHLDLVESSRDEGMDVTFDCFPYQYGATRLIVFLPHWAQEGGPKKLIERLTSPETRKRINNEIDNRFEWDRLWLMYFKRAKNKKYEGRSVADIAEMRKQSIADTICDLLVEEDLRISWTVDNLDPESLPDFVVHPLQMVGSDALLLGDFPNPMMYGTFPIILARHVRRERKMSLPEAIRKMTSYPAQRLGIPDRGLLKDGMKADIVVFDVEHIEAHSTRYKPHQPSTGIDYVIVNGKVVVDHGKHTGVLAGRALRRGKTV